MDLTEAFPQMRHLPLMTLAVSSGHTKPVRTTKTSKVQCWGMVLCSAYSDAGFCAQRSGCGPDDGRGQPSLISILCKNCFPSPDWLIQSWSENAGLLIPDAGHEPVGIMTCRSPRDSPWGPTHGADQTQVSLRLQVIQGLCLGCR